ncbi:hypothetical protein ACOI1H_14630 [Loktanella sp. DJP18]|uniref:hypothetical protein n=1 Tax=Loktanella sp. DJP18 TaxID=3409788 RepID=UPI003BB8002A
MTETITPVRIAKGDPVRIKDMPVTTIYIVDAVKKMAHTFYAVSEDQRSGHWFDFEEVAEVMA